MLLPNLNLTCEDNSSLLIVQSTDLNHYTGSHIFYEVIF